MSNKIKYPTFYFYLFDKNKINEKTNIYRHISFCFDLFCLNVSADKLFHVTHPMRVSLRSSVLCLFFVSICFTYYYVILRTITYYYSIGVLISSRTNFILTPTASLALWNHETFQFPFELYVLKCRLCMLLST